MELMKKRWLYIFNGFVVLLFLGSGLAWSIFVVPIENTFGWARSQTSLAFTMNILCFSVGSLLAGALSEKFSFSTLLKMSAIFMGIGFMGVSVMSQVWQLYLSYGIIVGTAIGMGYNCVVSSCPLWLPEKSGTATGLLLMGYAFSTAIFGPILNEAIASIGIVATFRLLAGVCSVGLLMGSFMLKSPTIEDMKQLPQNANATHKSDYSVVTKDLVKKPIFWIYYVLSFCFAGIGLAIINHASPMLTEGLMTSATFAAMIISAISICNGVGRLIWGMIYDRLNMNRCLLIIGIVFFLATGGLYIALVTHNQYIFILSACLLLFGYGGNATTIPSIIRELFGHRTFSLNYSLLCTNSIFSSFFPAMIGTIQVVTHGYQIPLIFLLGCTLFSLLTVFFFTKSYKHYLKEML